jgi:hypothetical protein
LLTDEGESRAQLNEKLLNVLEQPLLKSPLLGEEDALMEPRNLCSNPRLTTIVVTGRLS